jgi:hypothetical protein
MNSTKIAAVLVLLPLPMVFQSCGARIVIAPTSLTFAPQVVDLSGSPSAAQTITVTNMGNKTGSVPPISISGPYAQTNTCPSSLAPNARCTIEVTFVPNAVGAINGVVAAGSSHVSLSGAGLAPVGLQPTALDFGTVAVGGTAPAQTVTLTNNQSTSLTISTIATSGNFSQANNCSSSLPSGATCTLNITFQPTSKESLVGAISVSTDATLAAQPVGLSGIGSGTVGSSVSFSKTHLDFGMQEAGTTSAVQTVTLSNTNAAASLTVTSVTPSSGYTSSDTCAGKIIPPNGSCSIAVTFQPTANLVPIAYPGAITVADSDPTSPQVVGLSGAGVAPIVASPPSLDFGTIYYNSTSQPQTLTFKNVDKAAESLSITPYIPFVGTDNNCPESLASGKQCSIALTLGPGQAGPADGVVTADFSSGGFLSPQVVNLSACRTEVIRTPLSLNFGAVSVGDTSAPQTVTIGGGTFGFSAFSISGANPSDFAVGNNSCGTQLNGGMCSLDLTFTPAAAGIRVASLEIADDQHCSPQTVSLEGGSSAGLFMLTGIVGGNGSGNLTSNPAGLNCGSQGIDCSASFAHGTAIAVRAVPDSNSTFAGWSGACTGTTDCNLTMNADRQVIATFSLNPALSITVAGNAAASGTVTSTPPGIKCQIPEGDGCQAYFNPGTVVQLTATPGAGSVFAGWNGGCGGTSTCTVTMTADQDVGATFNGPPTISVGLAGSGTGIVTSTPAGINCPGQCSSTFPTGTSLTMAAAPGTGSGFDGWSGGPCSGTGSCSFQATSDQTLAATFDLPDFAVNVSPTTTPTLPPGGTASFNITVAGLGGFASNVILGCSAPTTQGVNCLLSSASVKPGGSAMLTVTTTGGSGALGPAPGSMRLFPVYAAWLYFPVLTLIGIGSANLRGRKARVGLVLLSILMLALIALQVACSGSDVSTPPTPAGTYTVNVSAVSGESQHGTSVSIIVQ